MSNRRVFMRLAIEEARKSVPEDDQPHPRVGAVATKGARLLGSAHRGQIRGKHAEEILVDTLAANGVSLSGATVYTTLEPCTSRKSHVPCAQLLAESKPRRVVIGTLDPNRDVKGEGVLVLQEAGIEVDWFSHDLTAELRELCREFFRLHRGLRPGVRIAQDAEVGRREHFIQVLYRLTSTDLDRLITLIGPNARAQVSEQAPHVQRVNQLTAWIESAGGLGLAELVRKARLLDIGDLSNNNEGPALAQQVVSVGHRLRPKKRRRLLKAKPSSSSMTLPGKGALARLVAAQRRHVENLPLLRHFAARESFAFLFPDVFIDPRVQLRKRPGGRDQRFTDWTRSAFGPDVSVAIIGASGVGKTTAIVRLYLESAEAFLSGRSQTVPVLVELRAMRGLAPVDQASVLQRVAEAAGIRKGLHRLPSHATRILWLLDGLDEFFAIATGPEQYEVAEWPLLREWHVLGARPEAYFRLAGSPEVEARYAEVMELQEWTMQKEVRPFVKAYLKKVTPRWRRRSEEFIGFLKRNDLAAIATTPLAVTMLLFIWRYPSRRGTQVISSRAELYQQFFLDWTALEADREAGEFRDSGMLLRALKRAAWEIFHWQRDPGRGSTAASLDLAHLSKKVGSAISIKPTVLRRSRSFLSLLNIGYSPRRGDAVEVQSFRHESLQAFLVAETLVDALISDSPSLRQALQTVFTYEVNAFVRERLQSTNLATRTLIERRLIDLYLVHAGMRGRQNSRAVEIRNGAMYYLGRLGSPRLLELYQKVRAGEIAEHPVVTGTIASGLCLMNNEDGETDYLGKLENDHPDDVRTRKYHLVYYGDLPYRGPDDYMVDTPTIGVDDWPRTRAALVRRMRSVDERDLRLRALDLRVFRRLVETRMRKEFTESEILAVAGARRGMEILPAYKQQFIEKDVTRLMEIISAGNKQGG